MRKRIITPLLLATALFAFAQTKAPLLTGDGKDSISATEIEHIARVCRAIAGDNATVWMLNCDTYKGGSDVGHVFRVHAYFPPRLASSRLLRGYGILCADSSMPQYWDQKSPRFGGWYSCDKRPTEYGVLAPAGQTVATNKLAAEPFGIVGTLADSEVHCIVDAVRLSTTNELVNTIEAFDTTHVRVVTAQKGSGGRGLHINLQKIDGIWKETERIKWRQ